MRNTQKQIPQLRSDLFASNKLAVPRLGNVQLRLHFLRRGTSGGGTNQPRYGIVIGDNINITRIGGNGVYVNSESSMPSGNVFPVKEGTDRTIAYQQHNNNEDPNDYWQAPVRFTTLLKEGNGAAFNYYRYKNEFTGIASNIVNVPSSAFAITSYSCYTQANVNNNALPFDLTNWVQICENSLSTNTVYFPYRIMPNYVGTSEAVQLEVFPNPTSGIINLKYSESILLDYIEVRDVQGRLFMRLSNYDKTSLDLSDLKSGLYFVSFKLNSGLSKVVKIQKI